MATKQKSGLYRTAVTVAGKKVWISAHTKKQLQDRKQEVRERLITGASSRPMTFHELVHRWWQDVRLPQKKRPSTIEGDRSLINKWVLTTIDPRQLAAAVRRTDLQAVITKIQQPGAAPTSADHAKYLLSQVCQYGMQLGCVQVNYAHNLVVAPCEQSHKLPIPDDVVLRLFAAAKGSDLLLISMLYYTGLRRGELLALTWGDIDMDRMQISITKAYDAVSHKIGPTKTKNSVRTVKIPEQLMPVLKANRGTPGAHLLPFVSVSPYMKHWAALCKAAGVDDHFTPHQFRHTYATKLHAAGIDPLTASRMMGHSSYKVTADFYTEIEQRQQDRAAQSLNSIFAQSLHKNAGNA